MVGWLAREGTPRWGTLLKLNSNSKGRAGDTGSRNKGELSTKVNEQNVGDLKKERALEQKEGGFELNMTLAPREQFCAGGDGYGRYGDGLLTLQG